MAGNTVGVLALQGDFDAHIKALQKLGASCQEVRRESELDSISGLVIPGGESTALLRLADKELISKLLNRVVDGLPVLATCAGLILLAKEVLNPQQNSLGVIDVSVERNGYGRQVDSFIDPALAWTKEGRLLIQDRLPEQSTENTEGVFIRAPRIKDLGPGVEVLIARDTEPVFVRQKNILASSFHPELAKGQSVVHKLFLSFVRDNESSQD